jgi:hypothetical protein
MEKIHLVFLFLLLSFLTACQSPIMTPQGFENIQAGTSIEAVEAEFGQPYEIETLPSGFQEYTYIQRIPTSPGIVDQVTYILYVCKGKVISKSVRDEQSACNINYR